MEYYTAENKTKQLHNDEKQLHNDEITKVIL